MQKKNSRKNINILVENNCSMENLSIQSSFFNELSLPCIEIETNNNKWKLNYKNKAFNFWMKFISDADENLFLTQFLSVFLQKIELTAFIPPFKIFEEYIYLQNYLRSRLVISVQKNSSTNYILNFHLPTNYFESYFLRFPRFAVPFVNSEQTAVFVINTENKIWAACTQALDLTAKLNDKLDYNKLKNSKDLIIEKNYYEIDSWEFDWNGQNFMYVSFFNPVSNYDWLNPNKLNLNGLINNLSFTMFITKNDAIGTLLYVNKNIEALTGYSQESFMLGKIVFGDLIHINQLKNISDFDYRNLGLNENYNIEYQIKTKDNRIIWITEQGKRLSINNESVIIGHMRDISLVKQKDLELKESEEKFRVAFETSPNASSITEIKTGRYIAINNGFEKISGYLKSQIIGKTSYEINIWNDFADRDFVLKEIKEKGFIRNYRCDFKGKNGKIIHGEMSAQIIKIFGHSHLFAITKDITDKILVRNQLQRQNTLLENIFDAIDEAILITDTNRQIIHSNKTSLRIFGYSMDDMIGKTTEFIYASSESYKEQGSIRFNEQAKSDKILRYTNKYKTKEGRIFIGETFGIKLFDENGEWFGNLGVIADVTVKQQLLKELKQAKKQAEESDKLKSMFLANMSHEIRTPMNGIIGFAQLLKESNVSKERQTFFIDTINKSAKQLLNIINDIIDISKLEAKQVSILNETLNLNEIIEQVYSQFCVLKKGENKSFEILMSRELPYEEAFFEGDPYRIIQILTNFLSNALKFTEKGYVKVGYLLQKPFVHFFVEDTGTGIPPEFQNSIFERFNQADLPTEKTRQGTGLGLSISKGMVSLMNGSIGVKSKEGKGSTFFFLLPLRKVSKPSKLKIIETPHQKINFNY